MRPIVLVVAGATWAHAQQIPAPAVRDSAGVRIVEHRTIKTATAAFTIAPAPQMDLGGLKDDPRAELDGKNPFANAFRLSDGRYVASDYAWYKMYDTKGGYIRTVGRAGSGPGEFHQLRQVCLGPGDTLIAIGYGDRRVSVFDSSGKHVRSFTTGGYQTHGACFADGSIVDHTNPRVNPATKMTPERAAMLDRIEDLTRTRMDGTRAGTVGRGFREVFAGAATIPNAYAAGRSLYVGDGRAAELRVFSIDGKLVQVIRWKDPLTRSDVQSTEAARGLAQRAPEEGGLGIIPAYAHILADEAGRIWIDDHLSAPAPHRWTVFAPDGRLLGRVAVPQLRGADKNGATIVDVHRDHVVLNWRDAENGARHVSFHAIAPAR